MVASKFVHHETWSLLDRHIVLSEFQREWLVSHGIQRSTIVVRPTAAPQLKVPVGSPENQFCFVGRLDREKGVDALLDAWQSAQMARRGWALVLAGDGPLREDVVRASAADTSIRYAGRLPRESVQQLIAASSATVLPSRWYEGFPKVVSESFALGRPVLAIDNENMRTVVGECGLLGWADDALAELLIRAANDPKLLAEKGNLARLRYRRELTPEHSLSSLLEIYRSIL